MQRRFNNQVRRPNKHKKPLTENFLATNGEPPSRVCYGCPSLSNYQNAKSNIVFATTLLLQIFGVMV